MKKEARKQMLRHAGAFTLGAAAGSAVALLWAPSSGKMLRKRIGGKFVNVSRSTARKIQQTKKVLVRKADHLKDAALEKIGDTREWLLEKSNGNGRHAPARRLVRH